MAVLLARRVAAAVMIPPATLPESAETLAIYSGGWAIIRMGDVWKSESAHTLVNLDNDTCG